MERIWPANIPEGNAEPYIIQARGMPTPIPSVEEKCFRYLIDAMTSEPEHRPKEWFYAECKRRFGQGLTGRGFDRSWNIATKQPGLGYRSRSGRKSKAKSNHVVISRPLTSFVCLKGGGPRFAKLASVVVYDIDDLDSWAAARKVRSTSERPRAA